MTPLLPALVCTSGGMPQGPLTATVQPADLGRARSACLRSEVGLGGGAALVVDAPDFYGRIQLMGTLDARVKLGRAPMTLDFGLEAIRQDSVIAPIAVSQTGLGTGWLGATWQLEDDGKTAFAVSTRVALPTASGSVTRRSLGADLGMVAQHRLGRRVGLHGGLTLYASQKVGAGPPVGRAGLSGLLGTAWTPFGTGFALVLDVPLSFGWSGPLDYFALTPGLRVGTGPWNLELGVMVPLVGEDRTLLAADLRTAVRFR